MRYLFVIICLVSFQRLYSQTKTNNIDALINFSIQKKQFRGSMLIAIHDSIIYQKTNGLANANNAEAIDTATAFYLASVSKTITSACVLQLIDKQKLKFSDNLLKFFPNFPEKNVTIKNLLVHSSGIEDYIGDIYIPYWDEHHIPDSLRRISSNDEAINLLIKNYTFTHFKTGRYFEYLNTNYLLLASIVEKVSGESFRDYLQHHIFGVSGMNNSFLYFKDSIPHKAIGYRYTYYTDSAIENNLGILNGVYGDGGIYSTPRDLLKFSNNLFSGKLLSKNLVNDATVSTDLKVGPPYLYAGVVLLSISSFLLWKIRKSKWLRLILILPVSAGGFLLWLGYSFKKADIPNYGMGWETKNLQEEHIAYHTGGWGGANNILWHEPSGITIIILTNNSICPSYELAVEISNILHSKPHHQPLLQLAAAYAGALRQSDNKYAIEETQKQWQLIKNIPERLASEESALNDLGYELMRLQKEEESVSVFKLTTDWFSNSWNVYDSYGEALAKTGKISESIKAYRQSLKLNPGNENASRKIDSLSKK